MKKHYFNFFAIVCLLASLTACNDSWSDFNEDYTTSQVEQSVKVTPEGYLHFSSLSDFQKVYNDCKNSQGTDGVSRAASPFKIPGFTSAAEIIAQNMEQQTRTEITVTEEEDLDCEEGTEEELRLSIIEELVPDQVLLCLLDTTLRIEIGDTYYRITYEGTLYAQKAYSQIVDSIAESGNTPNNVQSPNGRYLVTTNVYIADTYGRLNIDEVSPVDVDEILNTFDPTHPSHPFDPLTPAQHSTPYFWSDYYEDNTQYYGLKNRMWDAHTILGDVLEFVTGCKYITESNKFDKNHRVQGKLYSLDFVFLETVGFNVKLQKRKKVLFVTYWISCTGSSDLVIGMEGFSAEHRINDYPPITSPDYVYYSYLGGAINQMFYAGLCKPTFIEDWARENLPCIYHGIIPNCLEQWKLNPGSYTNHLTEEVIKAGVNSLLGTTLNGMTRGLRRGDPILNINTYSSRKHDLYLYGLNGWLGTNSKSVNMSTSFGFRFLNGLFMGWTPESFNIKNPRMFGAIKYQGVWKGVRFVNPN